MNSAKIEEFILQFNDILLEEHRDELLRYSAFLNSYLNKPQLISKYGKHYISCPWSKNTTTCGPDTCECCDVQGIISKAEKLIHFYYRIINEKCKHCFVKNKFIQL